MPTPRKIVVEFDTNRLLDGGWLWIREVRDSSTFKLLIESQVITSTDLRNPFLPEEPE